jgi:PDZ domain-containing protein
VRRPLGRGGRTLIAAAVLASSVGAWWSGVLPCAAVTAQPACQLAVSGGPVLDTARLLSVTPSGAPAGAGGAPVAVREPAGRLYVTTIEVWELDGVRQWWDVRRDPHIDLVARVRLVPAGGDLEDVAEAGRARMEESQARAVGLALAALGLVAGSDVPAWAWPVEVGFATEEVGGPSAGLMLALGVVARLAPVDPTARTGGAASGRPPLRVAGTGALEAGGRVVGVGGVDHKLRRAVADSDAGGGLDAFLLPSEDLPVARRTDVARDVLLVPVDDLDSALAALAALASGAVPQDAELLAGTRGRAR